MPDMLYVGLQEDDKIAVFTLNGDSGGLTKRGDVAAAGGPSVMAIGSDHNTLYVGYRTRPSIASYRIDPATGGLSLLGTAAQADAPTFLAPDRTGRYMLCAYYQGGYVAMYPIAADGTIGAAAVDKQETAVGAHAIATDPSNRFAFVPHIARIQDNVLEPPKNNPGPNVILQYRFDAQTGRLIPNTPQRVEQEDLVGPRHYIHHPS
ncbi:MAG: beta-propeller fold lactonase family protein, partial [Stellaceae bacterium]